MFTFRVRITLNEDQFYSISKCLKQENTEQLDEQLNEQLKSDIYQQIIDQIKNINSNYY